MRTIKKRLSAVLLSVYMVFGVVSTDYLTVQAFEWVVPSLTVGESLLWLMGLLGMTYTEGASAWRDVSPEYEQEFIDYANEHGLTYTETSTWLNDTASGKLNQLSDVWTNFKEWVKSLVSSGSSSGTGSSGGTFSISDIISFVPSIYEPINFNGYSSDICENPVCSYITENGVVTNIDIYVPNSDGFTFFKSGSTYYLRNVKYHYYIQVKSSLHPSYSNTVVRAATSSSSAISLFSDSIADGFLYYFYGLDSSLVNSLVLPYFVLNWQFGSSDTDSDFASYNPALVPDINFAHSNTEDASIPGVIDLPWGNLGDDEEERDKTYDDLVGGLDLGKEIGDLWQALQDLMGVLAVDDAGVLQPNSGGENPPTLEDEVENNKVNGAFVINGLQKVFPFCIPFDLYAFITLLEAPPVAPVIEYPIYNPVTKSNEIITIDFSTWESVVVLFRYIFDFLFIIGLLLMARALIGGGDSA